MAVTAKSKDGFLSKKDTAEQQIVTNKDVKLRLDGKTAFVPEIPKGRNLVAIYVNVKVSNLTPEQRKALHNGGGRIWYGQRAKTEADGIDETGLNGPIPFPQFGNMRVLLAHTWPHTVDADPWSFFVRLYAFDDNGNEVNFPVTLGTKEVKIIKFSA